MSSATPIPVNGRRTVAVLFGSLRRDASTQRVAAVVAELAPPELRFEFVDISRLSLYDPALDARPPAEWTLFREQIHAADGLLFLTSGNGRSIPVALRNAIAIGSHPRERNAWAGKPGGVMSVSLEGTSRSTGYRNLRRALANEHVPVMDDPNGYLQHAPILFDTAGRLVNVDAERFLRRFAGAFGHWVQSGYLH